MKQFKYIIVILSFIINSSGCKENSSPAVVNPQPEMKKITANVSENLYDVDFIDENTGYVVGDSGLVMITNDRGESWNVIKTYVNNPLACITFYENDLFIGGSKIILTSYDNGNTWSKKEINLATIHDIKFDSEGKGISVGGYSGFNESVPVLFIKNSKGDDWEEFHSEKISGIISSCVILKDNSLFLAIAQCIGFSSYECHIYRSINIGSEFEAVYNHSSVNGFFDIYNPNYSELLAIGYGGMILFSSDKGEKWGTKTSGVTEDMYSISGRNKEVYYAVGDKGTIISTSNKGESWQKQTSGVDVKLNAICFPSPDYGIIVGDKGTIIKIKF